MVIKTSLQLSLLFKFGYICTIGLALLLRMPVAHAQGSNVDLTQPEELIRETGDQQQTKVEGVTHLYFAFASETLDSDSQRALRSLADQAEANPDSIIVINAHTDNRGWALGNLELSRIRARSAARALMANGIEVARMRAFAFGESRPIAPNATIEGRRLNRRVEVSIVP